jgi:hypothetical protein
MIAAIADSPAYSRTYWNFPFGVSRHAKTSHVFPMTISFRFGFQNQEAEQRGGEVRDSVAPLTTWLEVQTASRTSSKSRMMIPAPQSPSHPQLILSNLSIASVTAR